MAKKTTPPSVKETAFDCPYCGAFTTQYWFKIHAEELNDEKPLPYIPDERNKESIQGNTDVSKDEKQSWLGWYDEMATGHMFFWQTSQSHYSRTVNNLFISRCYNCDKIAVWVHDNIIFPPERQGVQPNQDLHEDIVKDFEEARSIVGFSPRGAAALLRLCIQKLCVQLGEKGENINDDIGSLVSKGLNPLVQKALDIVRVIGNEAVHPGLIDLNDNRDIANKLFGLINAIADQMITHPKTVEKLYEKIPETKKKAIEDRNGKANQE